MSLVKLFTEVKRLFQTSNDAHTLYFELLRHVDVYYNNILVIFQNELALKQCFYKNMKYSDESDREKYILYKGDLEYQFITIDKIYEKSNPFENTYFKEIRFTDAFDRLF